MRILITNDDGIHAKGLAVLERIARTLSDDVWVVAPETDQSGFAHSLTISNPLRLRKIDDRHFSVHGTPTDCVIMAMKHILPDAPDLVLSGVNAGGNLADDITYSGTVAAAMEGTLQGIRSFALSQEYGGGEAGRHIPWETVEAHAPALLKKLIKTPRVDNVLLNINFPACSADAVSGVEVTIQGHLKHNIYIDERTDGRGMSYYWLCFSRGKDICAQGSDVAAVRNNAISVTPLQLDLTANAMRDALTQALEQE